MSELADDLERLCGEAAANGVKHWKFPLTMILSLAAALRESEELRRDAERLDFIERLADDGYAPRIVSDDDGRWALSDAGSQPVAPDGGHTGMVAITSFVEPEQWKPNIRAAIDSARGAIDAARKEGV